MMKTIGYILAIGIGFLCSGCENVDEKPPMKGASGTSDYILPPSPVLTTGEWDMVQAQKDEYNEIINR